MLAVREPVPATSLDGTPAPTRRRVLLVIDNPRLRTEADRQLSEVMRWYDPDELAAQYIQDVRQASYGLLEYEVAERIERSGFPVKADGFRYDEETFLRCWRQGGGFHQPDAIDYHALLRDFGVVERINAGRADEVWYFAFPYAGCYESIMFGPRATWCNAPPIEHPRGSPRPTTRFVVMGFNYEREVGCMLEDLGHRTESMMEQVYAGRSGERNLWARFTRYDKIAPGRASVGNVHFAPNSERDYDWGNPRPVMSDCDDWLRFPHLTGERRQVHCRDWGHGDMRLHHLWWFERLPHVLGETDGIGHNWWPFIGNPNLIP